MRCARIVGRVLLGWSITGLAGGQSPDSAEAKSVLAVRTAESVSIDGRLDEAVWSSAAAVSDVHQVSPVEYSEPSQRSQFLVLYDDEALYIAARMWDDEPELMTAKVLRQGGQAWRDDFFQLLLDPFNDKRNGYRFQLNPNGVRDEGVVIDTTRTEWNWDGIWLAAATQDDDGWVAETRIPFKTLSFNPDSDTWGINFTRKVARNDEIIGWVSRNQQQTPAIAGVLTGLDGIEQGRGLDVVPSVTLKEQRAFGSGVENSAFEPSLDVFYKVTPALNAALTLNTDFSATEVDARQVNLSRFGLFFPEKRDFFLQDADIFEFGRLGERQFGSVFSRPLAESARPFFSRTIGLSDTGQPVDLDAGGRVSGRVGRWNIGALAVHQDEFEDVQAQDLLVGRASRNVLGESSVGIIVTDGAPRSNLDNSVIGADFKYANTRLPNGRVIQADAWYQQSDTQGIDGEDAAWGAKIKMPNNTGFKGELGVKEIQANFNPAMGFVNRSDIRNYTFEAGYTHRPTSRRVRSIFGGAAVERVDLLTGELQSEVATLRLDVQNQTSDEIVFTYISEKEGLIEDFEISDGVIIPAGDYAFDRFSVQVDTGDHRALKTTFTVGSGDFFDGERDNAGVFLEWTPTRNLRTSIDYSYNDVTLPQGDFVLRFAQIGLDVIFSSTLSWVNLIQYDNDSEVAGINSRLHWIPQAGREMFIVLNHNLEDLDKNDSFHSTFADFSFKFNYTLRF